MNTLNLKDPSQSDIQFEVLQFPDGQPHIKLDMENMSALNKAEPLRIFTRITNSNDLLIVLLAKNVLDYEEFEHVTLDITYLMAARMDRVMTEGEPFSLKIVAEMINTAGFKKVRIFDPHSEMTTALIDKSYTVLNHQFVQDVLNQYRLEHPADNIALVSPDAGALKKIHKLAQYLQIHNVVECSKERDVTTGKLSHFKTTAENLSGQTCFIIDDICDGGGTFAGTAALLKQKGASHIVLVVSHGIFSRGIGIEGVDKIYTTDSYRMIDGIDCLPVEQYFL